jgi:hypothetical protein
MAEMERAFARICSLVEARALLGVETGTCYGAPALRLRRKFIASLKDEETLNLSMPMEEKELLMEAAPAIYYETDHYRGWPAVLIRLGAIGDEELGLRLEEAWIRKAGKTLLKRHEALKGK